MERTDPLEPPDVLTTDRFGHTPALWFVLPLVIGGSLDLALSPPTGTCLLSGLGCFLLTTWLITRSEKFFLLSFTLGTVLTSAAWHQLRVPPTTPLTFAHRYGEFSLLVEQAHPKLKGLGWTGFGIITDRDDELFRRRVAVAAYGLCPTPGAEIKISGHLKPLPRQPTGFDRWVQSQGATLKLTGGKTLGTLIPASTFRQWCQHQQTYLEQWWRTLPWADEEGGALLAATMLGRTALLPDEARQAFMTTGTLHLFAISGLHIAGMAGALLWFTKKLRLPEIPSGIVILGLLWLYVEITGASPSSLRAWMMALVLWLGQRNERSTSALQSLALAGTVTLLISPEALTDPGFQLSYLAVLAIITLGTNLSEALTRPNLADRLTARSAPSGWQRQLRTGRDWLITALCVSWSATIAGLPVSLFFFGQTSLSGPVANLILVPLSEIPLLCGLLSTACSFWTELLPLAAWCNGVAAGCLKIMTTVANYLAQMPYTVWYFHVTELWHGASGALGVLLGCLALANNRRLGHLLGFPLILLLGWLMLNLY
jgi:competence protein ComEC